MKKLRIFFIMSVLFVVFLANVACALTVFDNYGPGNTHNTSQGSSALQDVTVGETYVPNLDVAMAFNTGGTSLNLNYIDLTVTLISGPNVFDLFLLDSLDNKPNNIVEQWHLVDMMDNHAWLYNHDPLRIVSNLSPLLTPYSTYWLSISVPESGQQVVWYKNNIDYTGHYAYRFNSDWNVVNEHVTAAFRVDAGPTPVPEPGTLLLLGSGLAGLALYRRRMNKA